MAVETFTGSATNFLVLPGTPSGGGIDFTGTTSVSTLSFTPGSVTFNGQPVDFSGTEADWLVSSYTGQVNIPVNAGPTTVTCTGSMVVTGPALNGTFDTEFTGVDLGPAFGSNNLDRYYEHLQTHLYSNRSFVRAWPSFRQTPGQQGGQRRSC